MKRDFFGARQWFQTGTTLGLALVVIALGSLTGCGKKTPVAAPVLAPVAAEAVAAPAGKSPTIPPVAPVVIAANPDGGADLKQLNHAYIGWIVQSHQRPKTFEEYVAKSGVQVPPAPAGKKYIFGKSGFISLANQ